jgi:hypothetical protein
VSSVVFDRKSARVIGVERGYLFGDARDLGTARPALQFQAQLGESAGIADGVNFHATVAQIPHEAGQGKAARGSLREVAIANTLNHSADEIALCYLSIMHGRCGPLAANDKFYQSGAQQNKAITNGRRAAGDNRAEME